MECPSCGGSVDPAGVFPGGKVTCRACGASVRVPPLPKFVPTPVAAPFATPRDAPVAAAAASADACPRCQAVLGVRKAKGKGVLACEAGHGVFVKHSTLQELRALGRDAPAGAPDVAGALDGDAAVAEGAPRTLRCPRCGDAMNRRAFEGGAGVVVDACGAHGVWFDAGELRAALGAGALERADEGGPGALEKQAKAALDVALALELGRDVGAGRRAVDAAEDAIDLLGLAVFGGDPGPGRHRW